jgi:hypothetical protein
MSPVRLVVLAGLTLAAVGVALALQRRRPDPPSAPSYRAPAQLDRDDFTGRPGRWLIVLFGSTTCDTCPVTWATVQAVLASSPTAALDSRRVDVQADSELHRRYRIDGVPTTVIADPDGIVTEAFFGPMTAEQLEEALVAGGVELR